MGLMSEYRLRVHVSQLQQSRFTGLFLVLLPLLTVLGVRTPKQVIGIAASPVWTISDVASIVILQVEGFPRSIRKHESGDCAHLALDVLHPVAELWVLRPSIDEAISDEIGVRKNFRVYLVLLVLGHQHESLD